MLNHSNSLTRHELRLSADLSLEYGIDVTVFKDGSWIADAKNLPNLGYGKTAEEAVIEMLRINGKGVM